MPQLNTPILFLVFNRPDTTRRVFEQIARHRPTQLFIAADGPRESRPDDVEKCQEVRNILKDISWDCSVNYLYRDENLGCRNAIASAIDWFFTHVEEGIILEDDCLPNDSFFYFCQELLSKYKTDPRVMMISGDNFQNDNQRGLANYYFSRMAHIWGWATWRRAWNLYDIEMKDFPTFVKEQMIQHIWQDRNVQDYWIKNFTDTYEGKIDTWDYIWVYTIMKNNGLSIMPNVNLVSNIGFSPDASHTVSDTCAEANMDTFPIDTDKLKHPPFFLADRNADSYTHQTHNHIRPYAPSMLKRIFKKRNKNLK